MKVSKRIISYQISGESILIINTLTGAVDIINPQVYQLLRGDFLPENSQIDPEIIATLIKRGYLITNEDREEQVLGHITEAYAKTQKRLTFVLCPTYSCNLKCTYCFEGELTYNHSFMEKKDIDFVFASIDELRRTHANRKHTITLFGGEPLLPKTKPLISKILDEASKRSLPIRIVTNGTHLGRFTKELNINKSLIKSCQVTLDGPKSIHDSRRKSTTGKGTFDLTCLAVDRLLDLQIKTTIRINADLQNIDSIPTLFEFARLKGWIDNPLINFMISPVLDHSCKKSYAYFVPEDELVGRLLQVTKENPYLEKFLELGVFKTIGHISAVIRGGRPFQPLLYYCEANNLEQIVFGPDGYIYPCTECMGNREFALGEFKPYLKLYDEIIKMWNERTILSMEKCRECDIALLCGGGCAYSALMVNGDINQPVCNRARETIFAYLGSIKDELLLKANA
ncbi:MAG: radical SAM protein [Actinomycetota bacterium]